MGSLNALNRLNVETLRRETLDNVGQYWQGRTHKRYALGVTEDRSTVRTLRSTAGRIDASLPGPQVKLNLLNTVRLAVMGLAAVLLFSGVNSAMYPGYKVIAHPNQHRAVGEFNTVEIETSTSSRVFGIARVLAGTGLAGWVLWTFYRGRIWVGKRPNQ
jgi:hypothetical protein